MLAEQEVDLVQHEGLHAERQLLLCELCGKSFSQLSHLTLHTQEHNTIKPLESERNSLSIKPLESGRSQQIFADEIDVMQNETVYSEEVAFNCEMQIDGPFEADSDQKIVTEEIDRELVHSAGKDASCEPCSDQILDAEAYNLDKSVAAEFIQEKHAEENGLLGNEAILIEEEILSCELCGKNFENRGALEQHSRAHIQLCQGEEPYVCGFCGETFAFKSNAEKHSLIHNSDKPQLINE
ncbi:Zinc finger, C2H2 type [Popillia japonica]|uniref:Zinc finger, C2H2 type n=1 Tax=Popillia japonica TaxID=7064 RepID=A0AAW1MVT2_POPJA